MNVATLLPLVTVVALAIAAALYSHFRLGVDQNLMAHQFEHVSVLLARRHEIVGEILTEAASQTELPSLEAELTEVDAALSAARQILARVNGRPLDVEIAQRIAFAETTMVVALEALMARLNTDQTMTANVTYGNRLRELRQGVRPLQAAVAACNEVIGTYQRRQEMLWVRPFAKLFGYRSAGMLRIRSIEL